MSKELKIIYSNPESLSKLLGLGYEVINIEEWHHEPNTNYLVIGQECYGIIRDNVQLGLRGSNFGAAAMLPRVGLNDGSNYIFTWDTDWDIVDRLKKIENPDFEKVHKLVKDIPLHYVMNIDDAVKVFNELTDLPEGTWFGYDYESSGFPDNNNFIITGLGIATLENRYWIDFRMCMSEPRPYLISYHQDDEGLQRLNEAHTKFLAKHSRHCIVFNVNFELMATYRYTGNFYDYRDLNVTNIMKQYGTWCNLKWTIRLLLNVNSWDDKFDAFNEAFNEENSECPVCTKDEDGNITSLNFDNIRKRFDWITMSDCIEMANHFKVRQDSYYIMPSQWLGYYCSLDAYYTLLGWIEELPNWNYNDNGNNHEDMGIRLDQCSRFPIEDRFNIMSEAGLDVYSDGKIAESIVNNGGQLLNSDWWKFGLHKCYSYLLFTTTHLSRYYFKRQIEGLTERNNIEDYSPIAQKFIKEGIDITVGGYYLSKQFFTDRYYDEAYDTLCNENAIYEDWGQDIGQQIIDTLFEYCDDLEGINRKRKVHEEVGEIIDEQLQLSEDLLSKHENTVAYYQYKNFLETYNDFPWVHDSIEEYKDSYEFEGQNMEIEQIFEWLIQTLNINTTQGELEAMAYDANPEFRYFWMSRFLGIDWEDLGEDYTNTDVEADMKYFYSDEALAKLRPETIQQLQDLYNSTMYDETCSYALEHLLPVQVFKNCYQDKWKEIYAKLKVGELEPGYDFLTVYVLVRMWAKYYKIKSYYEGLYYEEDTNYTHLDKYWMTDYDPNVDCQMDRNVLAHPHFFANAQFSGRWSSNFHTVPSRSEVKRCTTSPEDSIFTYFDISSMEVRGIGYLAQDPKLVELFETHQDVYKFCGKFMLGEDVWNALDPDEIGDYRSQFKVVLLAYLYWRSAGSLAPELKKTKEETQEIMDSLGRTFPEVIEFRDYLSNYPLKHDGQLLTVFKEWIVSDEEPYRQIKHGINTVIQGSTAVMLVYGFYNLMKQAWARGWKFRSVGYVHDSSQSYFDIRHLFEMSNFYYEHVTKFLYDRFRVRFAFDIMCGCNYYDVAKLSQIDDNTLQFKGTGIALNLIMERLTKNNIAYEVVNRDDLEWDENGKLVEDIHDAVDDFINGGADMAIFRRDHSYYKLQIRKL